MTVVNTQMKLMGERHAPELPLPRSAVDDYAKRHGFSDMFVDLVQIYDARIMSGRNRDRQGKVLKDAGDGSKG